MAENLDNAVEIRDSKTKDKIMEILRTLDDQKMLGDYGKTVIPVAELLTSGLIDSGWLKNFSLSSVTGGSTAALFGVAALAAGAYYMHEVDRSLKRIEGGINDIKAANVSKFRGATDAVRKQVQTLAQFSQEVLADPGVRRTQLNKVERLEEECMKLLGQANSEIHHVTQHKTHNYDDYRGRSYTAESWCRGQAALLESLYAAAALDYYFNLGAKSGAFCLSNYDKEVHDVNRARSGLRDWQRTEMGRRAISRKNGKYVKKVRTLADFFKHGCQWEFILSDCLQTRINEQTKALKRPWEKANLQTLNTDVKLLKTGRKLYYLPAGR